MRDRDLTACAGCGRRWSGRAEAHCSACHLHFGGVGGFDYHLTAQGCKPLGLLLDPPPQVARRFKVVQRSLGVTVVQATDRDFPTVAHTCRQHSHPDDDADLAHTWWDHTGPVADEVGHSHATEDGTVHDVGCDGCLARYDRE